MESELTKWVKDQLQKRHWSIRELARQSGLSHSLISQALNDRITISNNFCLSIARAFGVPPEHVFRLAGILPDLPDTQTVNEITELAKNMPEDKQKQLLDFARFLRGQSND